jgi:Ca-activated chloride channel family protein
MPSSLFGPMALSGFDHSWFLLFLLVPLGLVAVYIFMRRDPPTRTLRFANMGILQRVASRQAKRWRQLPASCSSHHWWL